MSTTDKAYKKMKNIYSGCNSYNDEKKLYLSYNHCDIISYITDTCRELFGKYDMESELSAIHKDELINRISVCIMVNILEQLVFIRKLYDEQGKSENKFKSTRTVLESLITTDTDVEDYYDRIHNLLKRKNQKKFGDIKCLYRAFFQFYKQFLFNKSESGYHTSLYTGYANIVEALFAETAVEEGTYLLNYALNLKMPPCNQLDSLYDMYNKVHSNFAHLAYECNISEFVIVERLFGLKTITAVCEKYSGDNLHTLLKIMNCLSPFGFTSLHQYIIEFFDNDDYEDFSLCVSTAASIIYKTMQSVIYALMERFEKNDRTIDDRMETIRVLINRIKKYLKELSVSVPEIYNEVDSDDYLTLYNELIVSEEEKERMQWELVQLNIPTETMDKYILHTITRSHFGMVTKYNKVVGKKADTDRKYKYLSDETFSLEHYIKYVYGTTNMNEIEQPVFVGKKYHIKY